MKNPKIRKYVKAFCRASVVAALAFALPHKAQAQVNWLYFPMTDAPGGPTSPSSTAYGGLGGVILTGYNAAGTATDLHGAPQSGLGGAENGGRAMNLGLGETGTQAANGDGAANCIADLGDTALEKNLNSGWVVSFWFNQPVKQVSGTGQILPRMFVLSAGGSPGLNDGSANSIGVKFQQENQWIFSVGSGSTLTTTYGAGTYPAGDFTTNTWYFVAWACDASGNLTQYTGSQTQPVTAVASTQAGTAPAINLTAASSLVIGNRTYKGTRGFQGWMQDFRFDTGVPANPTAYLEAVRQASPGIILDVNFTDDNVNASNGQAVEPSPTTGPQMTGPAVIGASGDFWNSLHGFTYTGGQASFNSAYLQYVDKSLSVVQLSLSAPGGSFDNNCANWGSYSPFSWASLANENSATGYPNTPYAPLMATIIDSSATANGDVALTGLSPNAYYNLYTYSAGNAAGRSSTLWVDQGTAANPGTPQGSPQTSVNDDTSTTFVLNNNYLEFANVQADANGDMVLFFGNGTGECDLNGFQLQFVSGTSPLVVGGAPVITYTTNMNKLTLCTNTTLVITNTSAISTVSSINVTNITTPLGSAASTTVTNNFTADGTVAGGQTGCTITAAGIGTATATITITLPPNVKYSVAEAATDAQPLTSHASVSFDTYAPALVIEASDYNYGGGQFLDTPANGGVYLYQGVADASGGVDYYKSSGEGPNALFYRDVDDFATGGAPYVTQANADTVTEQKYVVATTGTNIGVNDFPELSIGYDTDIPGDWQDYTRTFGTSGTFSAAPGTYNVWLFMSISGGGNDASLSMVTPSPVTPSSTQTTNHLGQFGTATFTENDWNGFEYVPMTDQYGNLLSVSIGSGKQTFRLQVGPQGGPNLGFLMLTPSTGNSSPGFKYFYPDATHPFEATNYLTFTVTPNQGAAIASSGIGLTLNGANVTSGLTLTQTSGTNWTGNYPLQANEVYTALITVTNQSGMGVSLPLSFDTFSTNNPQWEAVDYDFSTNNGTFSTPPEQGGEAFGGWISGLHIDDPSLTAAPFGIPTGDITGTAITGPLGTEATNSYFGYPAGFTQSADPAGAGAIAQQGVDVNFVNAGQTAAYELYREADGVGAQVCSDWLRPKFVTSDTTGWPNQIPPVAADPNVGIFNLCYMANGDWLNYTHSYPAGNYYIWGRMAYSANYNASFGIVTGGLGTTNQIVESLGTFTDTNATGNQTWHWIPLLNTNGQQVVVSLTGQTTTFRVTANDGQNMEFFMLAQAPAGPLRVTATLVAGQIQLSFQTQSSDSYQVEFKSSLAGSTWTPVGSAIPGTGSTVTANESLAGTQGFYRVVATP